MATLAMSHAPPYAEIAAAVDAADVLGFVGDIENMAMRADGSQVGSESGLLSTAAGTFRLGSGIDRVRWPSAPAGSGGESERGELF